MSINSARDPLTDLYDRRTYNEDVSRYKHSINGIIQIDMNELKYVNDNYGHEEGDRALKFLSKVFEESINHEILCSYRLSGDEFVILMFKGLDVQLEKAVNEMKAKINESKYTVAIGYYYIKENELVSFEDAVKRAEDLMYADKSKHYKECGRARR